MLVVLLHTKITLRTILPITRKSKSIFYPYFLGVFEKPEKPRTVLSTFGFGNESMLAFTQNVKRICTGTKTI